MEISATTVNYALDIILILAGVWMVVMVRGVGGVVGRTMTLIVVGALITGFAHGIGTVTKGWFDSYDGAVHRVIVLVGFIFLLFGFREMQTMKR